MQSIPTREPRKKNPPKCAVQVRGVGGVLHGIVALLAEEMSSHYGFQRRLLFWPTILTGQWPHSKCLCVGLGFDRPQPEREVSAGAGLVVHITAINRTQRSRAGRVKMGTPSVTDRHPWRRDMLCQNPNRTAASPHALVRWPVPWSAPMPSERFQPLRVW